MIEVSRINMLIVTACVIKLILVEVITMPVVIRLMTIAALESKYKKNDQSNNQNLHISYGSTILYYNTEYQVTIPEVRYNSDTVRAQSIGK